MPQKLLPAAFADATFASRASELLDLVPDIKHEGVVCSLLAATLRRQGHDPRREVSTGGRRVDLQIGRHAVEAKYHFEGDLCEISTKLQPNSTFTYASTGWNSATKAICDELLRPGPAFFLWLVCVRNLDSEDPYKYPHLIPRFYRTVGASDLRGATAAAEAMIDKPLFQLFKGIAMRPIRMSRLPTIVGQHSALVSRLYHLP